MQISSRFIPSTLQWGRLTNEAEMATLASEGIVTVYQDVFEWLLAVHSSGFLSKALSKL